MRLDTMKISDVQHSMSSNSDSFHTITSIKEKNSKSSRGPCSICSEGIDVNQESYFIIKFEELDNLEKNLFRTQVQFFTPKPTFLLKNWNTISMKISEILDVQSDSSMIYLT